MTTLSRKSYLAEKIVFIDGPPGCGKSLLSQIFASFDRVELLSYLYDLEQICQLHYLDQVPLDSAAIMIKLQTDLKLYNTMMGRDVNFRSTDISSADNNHNPTKYINRLSGPGDKEIIEIIKKQKPILNLATHNLLGYSEPVWKALGARCIFIEVVRHPLYMMRQQALNMSGLVNNPRWFQVQHLFQDAEIPYYAKEWGDTFVNQNDFERAISFYYYYNKRISYQKTGVLKKHLSKVLTIPFELFVLNPQPWIEKMQKITETKALSVTREIMVKQKIPREKIADGIDIEAYRLLGWVPSKGGFSERQELDLRREETLINIRPNMVPVLDKICTDYEKKYWRPNE